LLTTMALVLTMTAVFAQPVAQPIDITANFCDHPPREVLCSTLPNDVSDFTASLVYTLIEKNAQSPFDLFSWQSFIALNWPRDAQGNAANEKIGSMPDALRRWQSYTPVETLFNAPLSTVCPAVSGDTPTLMLSAFLQAGGTPLVDQAGNYVVFDARVNQVMAHYIKSNKLETYAGQVAFARSEEQIDFPRGHYDNAELRLGGNEGAIEIKTAWRMFDPGNEKAPKQFFTVKGMVAVDAAHSLSGEPFCIDARLGLVGMHIVRRTQSGNGGDWIWTTFEHVDNAPFADNARGPNNIFAKELFSQDCRAAPSPDRSYSFFNASCTHCRVNTPTAVNSPSWKWAEQMPYARITRQTPMPPDQVSRCWNPSIGTRQINEVWQQALAGTVWQNYAVATTQWRGASKGAMFPHGEVPRYLTNSTMESFIQADPQGTCLGCHSGATTAAGQASNFSFVFQSTAKPE